IELYDPDGALLTSSFGSISRSLTKTGVHSVLVGTNLSDGMAGTYALTLGNIEVLLSSPNGGEVLFAGSTVPISWQSASSSSSLSSHDVRLSTDGGVSF